MDGVLFGAKAYPDANLTDLDCETGETYIGLGHRAPGVFPIEATVADFRMYVGPALTDADVQALAFAPGTESSINANWESHTLCVLAPSYMQYSIALE